MSREIKFRAWDNLHKKFLYDFMMDNSGHIIHSAKESGGFYYRAACEIEQYTGLKDKDGEEIYEGDVVEYGAKNITTVRFEHGGFYPFAERYNDFGCPQGEDVVVIGNIHENPELLEEVRK